METNLVRRYKRWRHGRGFGIHSPFAYDFITLTLRERLPYYAYDIIDAEASSEKADKCTLTPKALKLIFRIAVRFKPDMVAITGAKNADAEKRVIGYAGSNIKITSDLTDSNFNIINSAISETASARPNAVYIFPDTTDNGAAAACEKLWNDVTRGMRFDNSKSFSIIVCSPKLPKQRFDVKF